LISIPGVSIPAYRIEHQFPVIAIVGVLRPKLFIGSQIFNSLTPEEISAAVEHETGHLVARDNLKRGLLRACRDAMVIIPCGRTLDRAWAEASEEAADEHAARHGRAVALDLASALVKISRMVPVGARPSMPAGAFLVGDDDSRGVKMRVRHLIQIASGDDQAALYEPFVTSLLIWASFVLMSALVFVSQGSPHVLATVHTMIEGVVSFLS
jgi:beta-lactamase regulating signal transducer with metallopeptidase domain